MTFYEKVLNLDALQPFFNLLDWIENKVRRNPPLVKGEERIYKWPNVVIYGGVGLVMVALVIWLK